MNPSPIAQVLELARWAPSGDNTQPWRFEIHAEDRAILHAYDTRADCVYDFDGRASQLALGALIETMHIAASGIGYRVALAPCVRQAGHDTYLVTLQRDVHVPVSPLLAAVPLRSVQRRPLSRRPLSDEHKQALQQAAAPYTVKWLDSSAQRWAMASLLFKSARARLTSPEAYRVHRAIIAWRSRYSEDRVPDQAIGLDPLTLRLMAWVMQRWERVLFFNRYLAGTLAPRVQLDWLPGIACAGHFALVSATPPQTSAEFVEAGRAVQRFWLTATRLGLQLQPEMTPLIFSWYHDRKVRFSQVASVECLLPPLRARLARVMGEAVPACGVFMGRIGHGAPPRSRSLRRSLAGLDVSAPAR